MMQGHGPWPPLGTEAFQEGTLEEGESERHPLAPWLTSDPRILADQAWGKMLTVLAQMKVRSSGGLLAEFRLLPPQLQLGTT